MKFLKEIKKNIIIFFDNIRYPKRYLLKVRYLQRPFLFLSLRRLIYRKSFFKSFNHIDNLNVESLFKNGITTYVDPILKKTFDEIGAQYSCLDDEFKETSGAGYLSREMPKKYFDIIVSRLLPLADFYFGERGKAILRDPPSINYISRQTVNSANRSSSTDFWHIDTPNQLTMHLFCSDVNEETPHLYYCGGLHNKNFVDFFTLTGEKNIFDFYRKIFAHKVEKAFGRSGTICIFDPNGFHRDIIPIDSMKPRVYIHINFTPGNL